MNNSDSTPDQFGPREVWNKDELHISVRNTSPGGVEFDIRDLRPDSYEETDREYAIRVSGDDTWDLIAALNLLGTGGNEPVDLIAANIETIMQTGVASWLVSIGIDPGGRHAITSHTPLRRLAGDFTHIREVWNQNDVCIRVSRTPSGGVQIEGQDFGPNPFSDSDYEYTLTVDWDEVPKIALALGGPPDANPLDLIELNIETIVTTGVTTWLQSHEINASFWSF